MLALEPTLAFEIRQWPDLSAAMPDKSVGSVMNLRRLPEILAVSAVHRSWEMSGQGRQAHIAYTGSGSASRNSTIVSAGWSAGALRALALPLRSLIRRQRLANTQRTLPAAKCRATTITVSR